MELRWRGDPRWPFMFNVVASLKESLALYQGNAVFHGESHIFYLFISTLSWELRGWRWWLHYRQCLIFITSQLTHNSYVIVKNLVTGRMQVVWRNAWILSSIWRYWVIIVQHNLCSMSHDWCSMMIVCCPKVNRYHRYKLVSVACSHFFINFFSGTVFGHFWRNAL